MKTPEEIKMGLECCRVGDCDCYNCPYLKTRSCMHYLKQDALTYIHELESDLSAWGDVASSPGAVEDMARENYILQHNLHEERELNEYLRDKLKQLKAERDAAVKDLSFVSECRVCKHYGCNISKEPCRYCSVRNDKWEWRGLPEPPEQGGAG